MVDAMKNVAKLDLELTVEEPNLLSVGYKNVIGARRASWRILSSIEQKEDAKGNEQNVKRIKDYRLRVESELSKIYDDIMVVVNEHLIPSATVGESTVFYCKMKGDYYKYMAEFKAGNERNEASEQSRKAYELDSLKPKESVVIRQRYGLDGKGDRTLGEIAGNLNISREMLRKYEMKALMKLKHPARVDYLRRWYLKTTKLVEF